MPDHLPSFEDERSAELSTISAIFMELHLYDKDPFSAFIDLPVIPSAPLAVSFRPASADSDTRLANEAIQYLSNLPSLRLHITLPKGYPSKVPPVFELSTTPAWLSKHTLEQLVAVGTQLWKDSGCEQVVFAYIDYLQQAAENAFDVLDKNGVLKVSQEHRFTLLDFDRNEKRAAFAKETFYCGICLHSKKGSACHRMRACNHIFCISCLQRFYTAAITEGNLASVRCVSPGCMKGRDHTRDENLREKRHITSDELLQIPLEPEIVRRFVALTRKAELESDKTTVYCPRKWCQGAARSPKRRKLAGFEALDTPDTEPDRDFAPRNGIATKGDRIRICEDCSFAFCSRCFRGWHGEYTQCTAMTTTAELSEEEKASREYIKRHTTPCPSCDTPAQKSQGCCHMICRTCGTNYCYLCAAWLEPSNPYKHFNIENESCFQRLWELEGGDGGGDVDDVNVRNARSVDPARG